MKKRAKKSLFFDDIRLTAMIYHYSVMDKKMTAILYQNYSHFLVGEAGYCYAGLHYSCCSAFILCLSSAPHHARYREIFVPLFELCACGMRHSVGFAALLPSQLRTP